MSCSSCKDSGKCQRQRDKDFKKAIKIKKMLLETQKHDRNTCICKACWHFNMGFTIIKSARFYFVVENWKRMDRDEYLRAFQRILQYKIDKSTTKKKLKAFLKAKGAPNNMIPQIVEQMSMSLFVVMFRVSPMGMLKEI